MLCWSHWRDMTMVGTVYCTNSTSSVGSVSAKASQRGFMRLLLWNFRSARTVPTSQAKDLVAERMHNNFWNDSEDVPNSGHKTALQGLDTVLSHANIVFTTNTVQ